MFRLGEEKNPLTINKIKMNSYQAIWPNSDKVLCAMYLIYESVEREMPFKVVAWDIR